MNAKTFATDYGFNRTHNSGPHLPSFLSRALQSYIRWAGQRKTVRQLQSLDDHLLKDIGIARSDIDRVARL